MTDLELMKAIEATIAGSSFDMSTREIHERLGDRVSQDRAGFMRVAHACRRASRHSCSDVYVRSRERFQGRRIVTWWEVPF